MIVQATIGRRHTLVIPKAVRGRLSLNVGQRVLLRIRGGSVELIPLPEDPGAVLAKLIKEPYDEKKDEPRAQRWLMERAGR
ncbi:MAG TPA: AbrB/MazE/SpoVT family DNA-binding domain-containing protein [Thermoplasmata archaeon]|nr:AbrB/MazE/SpoVT family DNA-binding domain-containing protein [Thermoplasmata archaeon]